jgi:hypothetical protein
MYMCVYVCVYMCVYVCVLIIKFGYPIPSPNESVQSSKICCNRTAIILMTLRRSSRNSLQNGMPACKPAKNTHVCGLTISSFHCLVLSLPGALNERTQKRETLRYFR